MVQEVPKIKGNDTNGEKVPRKILKAQGDVKCFQQIKAAVKPGFHYTANATTTKQKQNDYRVEQSSFMLIAL